MRNKSLSAYPNRQVEEQNYSPLSVYEKIVINKEFEQLCYEVQEHNSLRGKITDDRTYYTLV